MYEGKEITEVHILEGVDEHGVVDFLLSFLVSHHTWHFSMLLSFALRMACWASVYGSRKGKIALSFISSPT